MTPHRIPSLVLTGGPSSGKTTALGYLVEHLTARGWRPLVVPEAATMLLTGGLADLGHLATHDRDTYLSAQWHLLALQRDLRERFTALAADLTGPGTDTPKVVLLHDRAELDNRAYLTEDEHTRLLTETHGRSPGEVAATYDAVLHLVTAAAGTGYTTANNPARTETAAQALALDTAVQQAWLGHPHYTVIRNEADFDTKLTRILSTVLNILGEPEPVEVERKWLLASPPPADLLARAVPVQIEQTYLDTGDPTVEQRVRARTHGGHTTHFHATKTPRPDGQPGRIEHEHVIDRTTYLDLLRARAPHTTTIRKLRHCFVHDGQHYELDEFLAPLRAWVLEAELTHPDQQVTPPAGLTIDREVTDDPQWSNRLLALAP